MKLMKRGIALGLSVLLLLFCFVGCASKGPTMMELGDSEITLNLFYLYLSRMKGTYCAAYGVDALSDDHWDTIMDISGKTYNEYYTEFVLNQAKHFLAACYVFDELGLELPDSYIDEIDSEMERMINEEANGSKTEFNKILADFGANVDVLREAYIIEAKIEYLKDYLYGRTGDKISGQLYEDYYTANYVRFKHILFTTFEYVYELDSNGDAIYYKTNDPSRISYDTSAVYSGLKDKNGDNIYLTEDGKIAYLKSGAQRRKLTNSDGSYQTVPVSDQRLQEIIVDVTTIQSQAVEGDYVGFEALMKAHNQEIDYDEPYPNGYYITKDTDSAWNDVRDKAFTMKDGEIAQVTSEYGVHLVMRYPLESQGYNKSENSDFFISNSTGQYTFLPLLKQYLLSTYVETYIDQIALDEAVLSKADMKSISPNFYY